MKTLKPHLILTPTGIRPVGEKEWEVMERAWLRRIQECYAGEGSSWEAYDHLRSVAQGISTVVGPSIMADLLMYAGVPHDDIDRIQQGEWSYVQSIANRENEVRGRYRRQGWRTDELVSELEYEWLPATHVRDFLEGELSFPPSGELNPLGIQNILVLWSSTNDFGGMRGEVLEAWGTTESEPTTGTKWVDLLSIPRLYLSGQMISQAGGKREFWEDFLSGWHLDPHAIRAHQVAWKAMGEAAWRFNGVYYECEFESAGEGDYPISFDYDDFRVALDRVREKVKA